MKNITLSELIELLKNLEGTPSAKIRYSNIAKLLKKDRNDHFNVNNFGDVMKTTESDVVLNTNYATLMEEYIQENTPAGETPEPYEPKSRRWGERISDSLVEHNGKIYLTINNPLKTTSSYVSATGEKLSEEDLIGFLPKKSSHNSPVSVVTINVDNIEKLEIPEMGVQYTR